MAVNDVGTLPKLQQKLQCCPGEVGKAVKVIGLTVEPFAAEEVLRVKCVDEIHPQTCT